MPQKSCDNSLAQVKGRTGNSALEQIPWLLFCWCSSCFSLYNADNTLARNTLPENFAIRRVSETPIWREWARPSGFGLLTSRLQVAASHESDIQDPRFEVLSIELVRTDLAGSSRNWLNRAVPKKVCFPGGLGTH